MPLPDIQDPEDEKLMKANQMENQLFASDPCLLDREVGLCRAAIPRYNFDRETKQCIKFSFGGKNQSSRVQNVLRVNTNSLKASLKTFNERAVLRICYRVEAQRHVMVFFRLPRKRQQLCNEGGLCEQMSKAHD